MENQKFGLYEITMNSYIAIIDDVKLEINIESQNELIVNGDRYPFVDIHEKGLHELIVDNKSFKVLTRKLSENKYEIWTKHHVFIVTLEDIKSRLLKLYRPQMSRTSTTLSIKSPLPGFITRIHVQQGEKVSFGSGLLLLEAMKMENEIKSPINGIVKKVEVQERSTVERDQILMIIEPEH